ncbi:hypothetical protein RIF29_22214 [Crotalaria pallida]|uniref:Uncharacterized protein n=1 Tax=Crotalaria pallida TaxID=3830 RepID=A0AAN9IA66_CROPI
MVLAQFYINKLVETEQVIPSEFKWSHLNSFLLKMEEATCPVSSMQRFCYYWEDASVAGSPNKTPSLSLAVSPICSLPLTKPSLINPTRSITTQGKEKASVFTKSSSVTASISSSPF